MTFWEEFTDIVQTGKTYVMKNLKVRKYDGIKYLNTPKDENCSTEETEDLQGQLAEVNQQYVLTTVEVEATIAGLNSVTKNINCSACHYSFHPAASKSQIITCTNCKLSQKLSACPNNWRLRMLINTIASPSRKLYLTLYHQRVFKLAELANINLDKCTTESSYCILKTRLRVGAKTS